MNNTRVFRFLSIALLAAIALYFAAQGYFALTDPFTTTLVYQSSAEDLSLIHIWLGDEALHGGYHHLRPGPVLQHPRPNEIHEEGFCRGGRRQRYRAASGPEPPGDLLQAHPGWCGAAAHLSLIHLSGL